MQCYIALIILLKVACSVTQLVLHCVEVKLVLCLFSLLVILILQGGRKDKICEYSTAIDQCC